jgi:hypothetical protein
VLASIGLLIRRTLGAAITKGSVFGRSLLLSAALVGSLVVLSLAADDAFARDSDRNDQQKLGVPVHGPGSSHNPIVHHPVHGPGSSHNPIVVSTSKYPPGTVVRDHRNGKNCEYTVGDPASIRAYNICEYGGGRGGGH